MPADTSTNDRVVRSSVEELLDGADRLGRFTPDDARSPAGFERVVVDGQRCVVKYVHPDDDFALRVTDDIGALALRAWERGLMDTAPAAIDHATLGMARWGRDGGGCAILMRDVSESLVPVGDEPVSESAHLGFLDDLAAFSEANWGFADGADLLPRPARWEYFGHRALANEEALGFPESVPRIAIDGWSRFADRAPDDVAAAIDALRRDAGPIVDALAATPETLLHGDWKFGNLGRSDGRTVLIDWAYIGAGPVAHEIAWYLALNRARLPVGHSKESTIADFAAALGRHGIDTQGWWERQLDVCLLGALVQFGWEKALGHDDELAWWCDRAGAGMRWL